MLLGSGHIVSQSLESLPIFALKHHFQLLPARFGGVSFFGNDVEGIQEVKHPGVECLPVLCLLGGAKIWEFSSIG